MGAKLSDLEAALGHAFATPELLVSALTHRSLANEINVQDRASSGNAESQLKSTAASQDNERLEFLGDAVLGLVVAEALFLRIPTWRKAS